MREACSTGAVLVALALAIAGCDEDTDPAAEAPLPVDLSGVWAGTWAGSNPQQGYITGTWEASVRQTASGVTGRMVLAGDVDCPDATLVGTMGEGNVVSGTIDRTPCAPNGWVLTALDLVAHTLSGQWTQQASAGSGTFTGTQISKRGGPHIAFFSPEAGAPGTAVTIVGRGFATDAGEMLVELDGVPAPIAAVTLDTAVVLVPATATTGRIALTTPFGTAMSARPFGASPSVPRNARNTVFAGYALPDGVAVGPDGRRVYVANRGNGTVSMLDLRVNVVLATTPVDPWGSAPVQGVAVSPDGRRIYVRSRPSTRTWATRGASRAGDSAPSEEGGYFFAATSAFTFSITWNASAT